MFIRPWLEALKSRWMPGKRRNPQRLNQTTLQSKPEDLEQRVVPAAFDLVTVIPNQGVFLTDGATMSEAPREVTLRFSPGQTITQGSLGAITVVRSGLDGVFDDPTTPLVESTDDVGVSLGYVGIGDNPNEVIVRFASTLADDEYQIRIQATGANALQSTTGDTFNTGVDDTFNINLDLGAQVEAVVPQPVIRSQVFTVANSASLVNGDTLTVTNGPYTTILEFNTAAGNVLPGHVFVDRTGGDVAVATAIANAVNGLGLPAEVALSASVSSQTVTITGSAFEPAVTFGNPVLTVVSPTSITDGDQLVLTLGTTTLRFEFNDTDVNNVVTSGYSRINFARSTVTQASINTAIEAAIDSVLNNPTQVIQANLSGSSIVFNGTTGTPSVVVKAAVPTAFAQSNTSQSLAKTMVNVANAASLSDADTLTLSLNGSTLIFEFNNLSVNNVVSPGRIRINYSNGATEAQIASAINSAVNSVVNNPAQAIRAILVGNSVAITGTTGTPAAAWTTAVSGVFTQNFGSLTQATDKVVVYFNQDQLDSGLAVDPTYYRLINVANGTVLLPNSVNYEYNPATGLSAAVLTFSSSLANASYNLKVGVSTEPNGVLANAINVGTIFTTQEFDRNEYLGDGSGTSSDHTDTDLYRFTLAAAGTVTFTLDSGATLDGVITFLDSAGVPVGAPINATGLGGQETLTTGVLGASTFYVRVSSASNTTGSYRLRISTVAAVGGSDDNSSFQTATNLGELGEGGLFTSALIEAQSAFVTMPQLPGGSDEPGHREIPPGAFTGLSSAEIGHGTGTDADPSAPAPTAEITFSFPATYDGSAAGLGTLLNEITPEQKEIIRMIFQVYSYEVGAQFREVASGGMGIVVGDLRAAVPTLPPPGPAGISGNPIILNSIFYANENEYGGGFTSTAYHEIGHNLGLGHSYDLPSVQGGSPTAGPVEAVFTGDHDLVHLLRALPNNSSDIDLYRFNVTETGTLSAQTIAERLGVTNLLNSVLTLYREDGGTRTVVARNDDFFSKDSGLEVPVTAGVYYIGVTSTGNDNYDPSISNSGFGGRSRGAYQLQLDFKPTAASVNGLTDTTGRLLDGDHDGQAGGEYNAWFNVAPTIIVDKLAPAGGSGTLAAPYNTISAGLAASTAGDIVRIVGNGGADRDASTLADNVPYAIGRDYNIAQSPLADGATFQVPQDVTVIIDAGTLIKLHGENVDVGTSSAGIDRSNGVLQVLGTPVNNVTFTSWRDDAKGSIDDGTNGSPTGADWGGIVFRQDSDSAIAGTYLNTVNHATLQYGGGQVSVDGGPLRVYNVIDLETSRPTITNNIIKNNADAAISANPDSFEADDGRIGPDIHGNLITQNSTNGLFVRIQTGLGSSAELLNVIARFDDTDITHVITQNLILNGRPGGALSTPVSARLMIDPGTIVKLSGARIETGAGSSNLIAEGTPENPIRFTSQQDDRFGAGGTFDVKNDGSTAPTAGNWSGFFVAQTSTASFDNVSITYAGGASEIAGNTDYFNPIETLQGRLRVTNSLFENNAGGAAATSRGGRGGNDSSTIFVRGAQPVLVNNTFRDNVGNVISINANSMQAVVKPDYGRSTGPVDNFSAFDDNYGPLVRLNKFANTSTFASGSTLGMNVRGEELTTESIWDDTDIAHVVRSAVVSNEFHTYGGLTLLSSPTGSLVVKLQGATAGFVATGDPLEITDRIGGTVQVIGQPGFPVILTSLSDDTISAGFRPDGFPQFDTNGDNNAGGSSTGSPGDWNSLSFDQYSNDTNVAFVQEVEPALTQGNDINAGVGNPQPLGNLAPNLVSGDENRRLGFEVHGFISPDSPGDVDVYSFTANPGTEVWIDTDFTSQRLDVMVELLNSAGTVLARSLNSQVELANQAAWLSTYAGTLAGTPGNSNLNPLVKDRTLGTDFYTSNFHDAGFRAVLPGSPANPVTFFVRVRSQPTAGTETNAIPPGGNGLTSGAYQLQVRLQQVDEIPGSTVRYADIRYATNGIELHGLPAHSPLMGEASETGSDNDGTGGGQYLGQLLQQDRNTLSVSGNLQSATDVDFYRFSVDYSQVQVAIPGPKMFPTVFDVDWADGLTRPDTVIAVFNSNFNLIYVGRESDIADDQPAPGQAQDLDDLTRSTIGKLDPYIGTVNLLATASQGAQPGTTTNYYVAVFSNGVLPTALTANFNAAASPETQLVRLEPINSIRRVVEDHIGYTGYQSQATLFGGTSVQPTNGPMFGVQDEISLAANIRPFTLSDVNLYVTSTSSLFLVDPFYGTTEVDYANYGDPRFNDLDMRSDGRLYGLRYDGNGTLVELNPGSGAELSAAGSGIAVKDGNNNNPFREQENGDGNANTNEATAITFRRNNFSSYDVLWYAITSDDLALSTPGGISKLYRATTAGNAAYAGSSTGAVGMITDAPDATRTIVTPTTGMQYVHGSGQLYGVSQAGQLYRINDGLVSPSSAGGNPGNGISQALAFNVIDYSAALGAIGAGSGFTGLADAPQNVENGAYSDFLFATTNNGSIVCIDPNDPNPNTALQAIFDSDFDGIADSARLSTGVGNPTGLAFSPVDFNLWHTTRLRSAEAGHGINTTGGALVDNSRVPSTEAVSYTLGSESFTGNEGAGNASMYFGLETWAGGAAGNYAQYQSNGQLGVLTEAAQRDFTGNPLLQNSYNVPGGAYGSLVTNSFSLEGYAATDKPTLYFNYWLQTEGAAGKTADSMRDSARVYVSVDNGETWTLAATNNSTPSAALTADAELPAYLSTNRNASFKSNQGVQELFDTAFWRQARIDLNDYVGATQIKLRFDFSTSGRSGTIIDPNTGLLVASNDVSNPTYVDDTGGDNGLNGTGDMAASGQNNAFEGFYIDDIIVGFAGRGEMVTSAANGAATTNINNNPFSQATRDPDPNAAQQLLSGNYQLEIRRGEDYSVLVDPPTPQGLVIVNPTLDINDRQTNGQTIQVGNNVQDTNSVTVYNGLITRTFEFNSIGGVSPGNISVAIAGTQGGNAANLAAAINTAFAGTNTVIAKAVSPSTNSDRIDIFGAVTVTGVGTPPPVTALGGETESSFFGWGNDYPLSGGFFQVANILNPFSAGVDGYYSLTGEIGNSQQSQPDSDFFEVAMTSGQTLTVDLTVTGGTGTNYVLGILDSGFNILAFASNGSINFTATATQTYYVGVLGDDGNALTSPIDPAFGGPPDPLASAGNDTFLYTLDLSLAAAGSGLPVALAVDSYVRQGDDNLERTQGQFIIENNTILYAAVDGIIVDDDERVGTVPHPGAPINTSPQNTQRLVTGVYIQNNVVARFGTNGINVVGDPNQNVGPAITPFVKIVNNTIYGADSSAGTGLADVVFLIDNSGSMGSAIATLVSQLLTFDQEMQNANIDANYGLVQFPRPSTTAPQQTQDIVDFATFTAPGSPFLNIAITGAIENGSEAVSEALNNFDPSTTFNFRPGARRVMIMLTNEDDDSNAAAFNTALADLLVNNALFYAICTLPPSAFDNTLQTYGVMATNTGGQLFSLSQFQNNTGPFFVAFTSAITGAIGPGASGVGINVQNNAGPTLMNNVIVNTTTGIQIDASSTSTTEVEANLFQNNGNDGTRGNNALFGADTAVGTLFVNAATNNYYPAYIPSPTDPNVNINPIVDSSRNNFNDRAAYIAATGPFGIPPSPMLAPNFDRFGQLRVDDPDSSGPTNQPGLGQNPFQDRGALERADFEGGVVIPVVPQDNDGAGMDYDPALNTIWIDAANPVQPFAIQTQFVLQLIDSGIGIDDDRVDLDGRDFMLLHNGTPLVAVNPGVSGDYYFTYNRNTNEVIFTSVSTFPLDGRYQIVVNAAGVTDYAGNVLQNNQANPITPANPQLAGTSFESSLLYFNYIVTDGDNDAPVTTAPASVTMNEDTTFTFDASNLISVYDQDAFLAVDGDPNLGPEGGRIQVTVYVPDARGTITSGSTVNLLANGGSFIGTGTASDPFIINGRIVDINEALANLQYTPPANFPMTNTPDTVTLTVFCEDLGKFGPPAPGNTDPQTSTQTITITVNPVNDPPTLGLISPVTVLEDSGTTNVPLAGISAGGGENQALTVTVTSSDTNLFPVGSMVVNYTSPNATGSIDFTPAPNRFGTANITVFVRDAGLDGTAGNGDDATTSRTFTFTVTGVNDSPAFGTVANQTVLEDSGATVVNLTGITAGPFETQVLSFTAVSSDPTIVPDPVVTYTQGSSVGTLSFTPVANSNGVVTITLTVTDDGGTLNGGINSYFQTFTITVTPVNDAPTLTPIPNATLSEDAGLQTVNLTGVSAGPSDESSQTVTITAISNNQALIPDGNIVVNYVSGNPTGTLTYTPVADQFGTATITVTVTDNGGTLNGGVNVLTRTFNVTVNSVNDAPTLDPILDPAPINEDDGLQTINLTGITAGPPNESSQGLTITAVSSVPGLIPNPTVTYTSPNATGTLTYTPVANQSGTATITVTVTDNGGTTNGGINTFVRTFNVVVNAVNDAPTLDAISNPAAILEDAATQTVNLTGITAGPSESQALEVTATSSNTALIPNGNISVNYTSANSTGSVSYTPAANENGVATITVTVRDAGLNNTLGDGDDGFTTRTFDVNVTAVNDAPTLDPISDLTILEDAPLQTVNLSGITVGPGNEVGQSLVLTAVSSNTALIPNPTVNYTSANPNGSISFTPQANANGTATITVTLTDNGGILDGGANVIVRTFTVTVTPVNDAPTNIALSGNMVFENRPVGTVVGSFSTTDVDLPADSFTYALVSGSGSTGNGSFQIVGNQLRTAESFNFEAQTSYSIRVQTTDSFGLTFEKTFTIQIVNINDAPTLNAIPDQTYAEDSGLHVVNLSGITTGGDTSQNLTVTAISSDPTIIANPVVTYTSANAMGTLSLTPLPNQNGTVTITVTVTDSGDTLNGGINTVTRTFLVTVTPVNDAPTDINLSNDTIPEIPAGTPLPANVLVGQLTSVDPDVGDTFQYQLVSGAGGTDNAKFQIVNDQLFAQGPIDFDMQPTYSVRVRTTDTAGTGLTFDKVLTIVSTNVNEPATGISTEPNPISGIPNSIPENRPVGSVVGTLVAADPDEDDVTTFALVSGAGATDNALFSIVNGQLIANQTFNFEVKNSYTVRIRATDALGLTFETPVVISVTNVNETPTNINLSNSTVVENTPVGTPVGNLTTADVDLGDAFTYTLVSGTGSTDNAKFAIVGDQLVVAVPPNYEDNSGHFYTVRVRSTDAGGLSFEKSFTITITDVNESPTALMLSSTSVNENRPVGTVIGTFSTTDQDVPETFTYALVSGVGSTDNAAFTISGNQLQTGIVFDFEAKSIYSIRVRTTDSASHSIEQVFTITINDTLDGPVITLADPPLTTTGRKPVIIDPGALITDIDSPNFNGGRLVVAIQEGEQTGDVLGIHRDKSTGMTLKAVRGKTILRLGKQDIATISGGVRGIPLTIQFGAGISKDLFQLVMRNINFRGKPFAAPRVITMQAFDDAGIGSNIETRNINVL